jgi:hypothetical protein
MSHIPYYGEDENKDIDTDKKTDTDKKGTKK